MAGPRIKLSLQGGRGGGGVGEELGHLVNSLISQQGGLIGWVDWEG